jgi:Skp family chaperone for outer membrane proteins
MATKKKPVTPAEQSAIDALQEELDRERLQHVSTQQRLQREVAALQHKLEELDSELARARARERELAAQLTRKNS